MLPGARYTDTHDTADGGVTGLRPATLEEQLVASGGGDAPAFAAVYDATAPRVFGLVLRILRDAHHCEEVTQEVYLEAWRTSSRFDPERGTALTWLVTMAHHRAVDRVRGTDASRRRDAAEAAHGRTTPFDQTTAAAHASLDAQRVRAALATLSPGQRQALELTYFEGYTSREISGLLQLPLGTTKSRIRDGLIRLRDLLSVAEPKPA